MELMNLLAGMIDIPLFGQTFDVSLNWIGKLISWLIKSVGTVGVGIIIFSLCLKIIVLPFDVYQRISMRKQNQQMKDQKERMERLQKQYANDKQMYNQKLMEMYRENGISMFSSCLPMILSMVIFIVAINAFNAYAQFSTINNYNHMVDAYKEAIIDYTPDLADDNNITIQDGKIIIKDKTSYLYYEVETTEAIADKAAARAYVENVLEKGSLTNCYVNTANISDAQIADMKAAYPDLEEDQAIRKYFVEIGQKAVLAYYDAEDGVAKNTGFLWIKNIWMTDASYKHPVCDYTTFETEAKREKFTVNGKDKTLAQIAESGDTNVYMESTYNVITEKLTVQKEQANGYFILIALSIGTILLQQVVTMRSQKEQQQFSTVDGQGASQQKMMLFMMTGMFAIFSFMYSSAFSIYMITSNLFSLGSTLIINKYVDSKLEKAASAVNTNKVDNRNLSRIEAAKQAGKVSAQDSKGKKNKDDKTE